MISEIISLKRKEMGLTLRQLSKKTNISIVSLNKYEKRNVLPTTINLYRLAQALELDYEYLSDILKKEKAK